MITYRHDIPAMEYNNLRVGAGWRSLSLEQAEVGLSNSAFLISAWDEEKPVGVARVISDRGYIYLIVDVIVTPEYQGQGIGSRFLNFIENDIRKKGLAGIFLQTDIDKPAYHFYHKNGFNDLDAHISLYKSVRNKEGLKT